MNTITPRIKGNINKKIMSELSNRHKIFTERMNMKNIRKTNKRPIRKDDITIVSDRKRGTITNNNLIRGM